MFQIINSLCLLSAFIAHAAANQVSAPADCEYCEGKVFDTLAKCLEFVKPHFGSTGFHNDGHCCGGSSNITFRHCCWSSWSVPTWVGCTDKISGVNLGEREKSVATIFDLTFDISIWLYRVWKKLTVLWLCYVWLVVVQANKETTLHLIKISWDKGGGSFRSAGPFVPDIDFGFKFQCSV